MKLFLVSIVWKISIYTSYRDPSNRSKFKLNYQQFKHKGRYTNCSMVQAWSQIVKWEQGTPWWFSKELYIQKARYACMYMETTIKFSPPPLSPFFFKLLNQNSCLLDTGNHLSWCRARWSATWTCAVPLKQGLQSLDACRSPNLCTIQDNITPLKIE